MSKLPYLVAEINAALEVYLSGHAGQQYNRTAFILCDDCAELASKLFLLTDTSTWSDTKANGHFKTFKDVSREVRAIFSAKRAGDHAVAAALLKRIETRRNRRNEFFHSTSLLDLNFHARDCVEAFCDLLDYGNLLFPTDWATEVGGAGNMETCEALIRLDRKTYGDPSVGPKVNNILAGWPRNSPKPKPKGCEVTHYAEDMHLRLAIRNGGNALRDKLRALL
ncbi:MAG: hypothetical protein NTY36_00600 [Deltaproteobacteria bacterium]|nr:hypothetical protein [Deltaproteobacteria bacterium]